VFSLKRVSKSDTFFQSSADSSLERLANFFGVSLTNYTAFGHWPKSDAETLIVERERPGQPP